MTGWIGTLAGLVDAGEPVVAITVAGVRGSAPRETGARMLVTASETSGTIGGGRLEYECSRIAAGMLRDRVAHDLRTFPLGASMGQCCGGVVDVLFEFVEASSGWLRDAHAAYQRREPLVLVTDTTGFARGVITADGASADAALPAPAIDRARALIARRGAAVCEQGYLYEPVMDSDFDIAVFGAGHVGSAVVAALAGLDCKLRWIDSRRGVFGPAPANVVTIETPEPALDVAAFAPGAYFLVMTHSHALDLEITSRILERGDFAYCGLIGSRAKRRRFEKRLLAMGLPASRLGDLRCPIGIDGITGKKPAEIAIAVAAELLREREARAAATLPANVRRLGRE